MKAKRDLRSLLRDLHAVVFERRSILLLLEDEWHRDRPGYWGQVFDAMNEHFPALARITLAQSVVRLAREAADLLPLVERAGVAECEQQALRVARCLFGMAGADPQAVEYAPWLHACSLLAQRRSDDVLRLCTTLVLSLFDRNRSRSPRQLTLLSSAARQLFVVAWEKENGDPEIIAGIVQAVIETFRAAPVESATLLEKALRARSHRAWPMCVLWQARMVNQLLEAPQLVANVYTAVVDVFSTAEAAHDAEELSWLEQAQIAAAAGRELSPMPPRQPGTVHRDAIDALEHHVERFVSAAPLLATRTLVSCIDRWLSRNDAQRDRPLAYTLVFLHGNSLSFARRLAYLNLNDLTGTFCGGIVSRLATCDDSEFSSQIQALIAAPAPGIVWEALIDAAAHDARLRSVIEEWFEQPAALQAFVDAFSRLIKSGSLSEADKARIRDTLEQLEADRATKLELETALASPKDEPDLRGNAELVAGGDSDVYWLRQSLNLSQEEVAVAPNGLLIALARRAERLEPELSAPERGATKSKYPEAVQVIDELQVALRESANPKLITYAWCALAGLSSAYASAGAEMAPDLLLVASERKDSLIGSDEQSRDLMNKARFMPRARSVPGLMALLQRVDDERLLAAIERLSKDGAAAVRHEVAWHLQFLSKVPHERLWTIVSRLVRDEDVVVATSAVHRLGIFFGVDAERALQLSAEALRRFDDATSLAHRGRADALFQLAWYHLTQENKVATAAINHAIESIHTNTTGFRELLHAYRKWLTLGDDGDDDDNATRKRTYELFVRIARASIQALNLSTARNVNARIRTERPAHAQLLEALAMELYFASGAFNEKHGDASISGETLARFYAETRELLTELGVAGVIAAAERVLETLQYLLFTTAAPDPSDVRRRFEEVAESAIKSGLGDEVWRLDPIEDVLRRLIADDPSQFDESMLSAWDRIVGALVEKGWRQAFLLARDFDLSL